MPTYTGADGADLYYDELGSTAGEPALALAGGAALDPSYLGDLAGLAERHPLVVPHLRGVGKSPMPSDDETGSYWRQADDLESLRRHLGLERVVLIGHSAGTRLAIAYAAQHPDCVARLILITPPTEYLVGAQSDVEALRAERANDPTFQAALAAWQAGPDPSSDETFNVWQQASAPLAYAAWTSVEEEHARAGWFRVAPARAYFSVEPPADLAARLAAITAPVLVVAGEKDCSAGTAGPVAAAALFPVNEVAIIEGSGHFPWVEQPAAFRRVFDAFLDQPLRAPAR